jgi:hypothetical protein
MWRRTTVANHYRVSPKYWIKARRRGWNDAQTTLGLYLLTCEHRNLEGLYRLPKPYIAADLDWPARKVEETLAALCEAGFAAYDEDAQMVLIPKALKHQAPSTDNQIKGAIAQLERIPRTSLWDAFRMACASHCPKLADAIAVRWPSHEDGASHAHAGSRAPTSSSSSSSSSPPKPPTGGSVVTFDRKPVPSERLELAQAILQDFNDQAGTSYGPFTGRGRPSEDLKRVLGALADADPPLTLEEARRVTRARLARPFWEGRPHTGVVFGPKVFAGNREAASNGSRPSQVFSAESFVRSVTGPGTAA